MIRILWSTWMTTRRDGIRLRLRLDSEKIWGTVTYFCLWSLDVCCGHGRVSASFFKKRGRRRLSTGADKRKPYVYPMCEMKVNGKQCGTTAEHYSHAALYGI